MSKKRKLEDDDETKADVDPAVQDGGELKRTRLTLPTVTTLMSLPSELHEHILLESVVAELRDRRILRYGWKESAGRVVERLRKVCPQWDGVLAAPLFRARLHALIDTYPQVEICLNILAKKRFTRCITAAAMNNEVFVLRFEPEHEVHLKVYAHDDLVTAKRSVHLPRVTNPWDLVACSSSNCLYLLHQASSEISILRIAKEGQEFQVAHLVTCPTQDFSKLGSTCDGKLLLFQGPIPSKITVYNEDGSVEQERFMDFANPITYVSNVLMKSNNNCILLKKNNLTEYEKKGSPVYDSRSPNRCSGYIYGAMDENDRVVTIDVGGHVGILDSDFNSVQIGLSSYLRSYQPSLKGFYRVSYDRTRNEFVAFENGAFGSSDDDQCLTIFNLTERIIPSAKQK